MKLLTQYIQYLQDNPKGYWFKRKLYGWGWAPARTQGWVILLAYVGGVVFFAAKADDGMLLAEANREVMVPILILTTLLIVVCYLKGEKPKWQWGKRVE